MIAERVKAASFTAMAKRFAKQCKCNTARIAKDGHMMFLIIGNKRGRFIVEYLVATGETELELPLGTISNGMTTVPVKRTSERTTIESPSSYE